MVSWKNIPWCIGKRSNAHYPILWTTCIITALTVEVIFWLKVKNHSSAALCEFMICFMFTVMKIEECVRRTLKEKGSDTDDTINTEKDETQYVSLVFSTSSSTVDDTSNSKCVENELKVVTGS